MDARLILLATLGFATPLHAVDLDGDGMCDVWEARFRATALAPENDDDHDGQSNAEEAKAGTNPFDPGSVHRADLAGLTTTEARIDLPARPGKRYQVFVAGSPEGPWAPFGAPALCLEETLELIAPRSGDHRFYRVAVTDADTDSDGVSDWAELLLNGFDRTNGDSFASGTPGQDLADVTAMLQALQNGDIAANAVSPAAYEKDLSPAVVTFSRPAPASYPFTLFLSYGGATDSTKSSASEDDHEPLPGQLVIPAGVTSADLTITPLADTRAEVPEQLRILVGGSSVDVATSICDAAPVSTNQRLLVGYLRPLTGTGSLGGGLATVRLPGDNDVATVTVSFSNLQSPVNSTQVQTIDSAILQSVPPFNYGGQPWPIRASQSYATDQQVLDALLSGNVKLTVFTESHVGGEIEGQFDLAQGSTEFQPPPDPPVLATLAGDELDREIVRFLTQATFGPTDDDVATLRASVATHGGDRIAAFDEWIDQQFALPSPSLLEYTIAADRQEIEIRAALPTDHPDFNANFDPNHNNRRRGWWLLASHAPDQLRQRAAFALSEIFVISDGDALIKNRSYGAAHYYDMLRTGASGTYHDLLEGVATHPVMGQYLSHLRNGKAVLDNEGNVLISPDENFAREIMQLFSIGLVELHPDGTLKLGADGLPIPTYDQNDITEMARVFTGWSFGMRNNPSNSDTVVTNTNFNQGNGSERYEAQWTNPMAMFADYHDTDAKSVLGLDIPTGQSGEQDLADVVGFLANHPNTAPFICRRLIQRMTSANPSAGYLYRVSDVFTATGGNLEQTIKAVLLDPEARSLGTAETFAGIGKKREPILRYMAFLRAFGGGSELLLSDLTAFGYPAAELAKFPAGTTRVRMGDTDSSLGQTPQAAPSVFNWFLPDYTPAGLLAANGVISPEFQLANESSVYSETNRAYTLIYSSNGQGGTPVPAQADPPSTYSSTADHVTIDFEPLHALYLGVVDTNGDGLFTSADATTFDNPDAIRDACAAVLDHIDLMLCAGTMKARYGETAGLPRRIILGTLTTIRASRDDDDDAAIQADTIHDRVQAALWLVSSSPDAVIQK